MAINWSTIFSKEKIASKVGGLLPASYIKKANGNISDATTNYTQSDLTTLKNLASQKDVIKAFVQNSPDASLAESSLARTAITDNYTIVAYSLDGRIDVAATTAATMLTNRLDKLKPSYKGFNLPSDFRSLSERAVLQICLGGSVGSELVLSKGFIPEKINIFSTKTLKYKEQGEEVIPYIQMNGVEYTLDSPLVHIVDLDQDVDTPYSISPFNAATQPLLMDHEFINDLRRAFSKASLPRVTAKILTEKISEAMPMEIKYDGEKQREYINNIIDQVREEINNLSPEDAVVHFDSIEISHLSAGNISSHNAVKEHKELINGKVSAGLRTLPAILGRGASSTTASTESMMYLLAATGVQCKLNSMYSTLLTTGLRLLGFDCYVDFKYEPTNLRPQLELSSFKAMDQARVLELCSWGLISDEQMSIALTGGLPSGNFTPLSGTGFYKKSGDTIENPYSNTSVTGSGVNETQSQKNNNAKDKRPAGNKTTG